VRSSGLTTIPFVSCMSVPAFRFWIGPGSSASCDSPRDLPAPQRLCARVLPHTSVGPSLFNLGCSTHPFGITRVSRRSRPSTSDSTPAAVLYRPPMAPEPWFCASRRAPAPLAHDGGCDVILRKEGEERVSVSTPGGLGWRNAHEKPKKKKISVALLFHRRKVRQFETRQHRERLSCGRRDPPAHAYLKRVFGMRD